MRPRGPISRDRFSELTFTPSGTPHKSIAIVVLTAHPADFVVLQPVHPAPLVERSAEYEPGHWQQHLLVAENGKAYADYLAGTVPGWTINRVIEEMLDYHVSCEGDDGQKQFVLGHADAVKE